MKISIVVPAYNEVDNLEPLYAEVAKVLKEANIANFELLFVNDGSSDRSLDKLKRLSKSDAHVKYLSFSRNFGHQAALRAGMAHSTGDAVITMDADLQHPPALLPKLIERWQEGYAVVYTRRRGGGNVGIWKRLTSAAFYRFSNFLMGMDLERGTADFRLLDRQVITVINSIKERRLFMRAFVKWVGFRSVSIDYVPAARSHGASKYTFSKMQLMALDGITQFSIRPLRIVTMLGSIIVGGAFLYSGYVAWVFFDKHKVIAGWTSLMLVMIFLFGMQFLVLGIIGEYLGRTFLQTKDWPDYIIEESNTNIDDATH